MIYFDRTTRMMGMPELMERFGDPSAQFNPELKEEFEAIFLPWCAERTKREIVAAGQAAGVLCGPINTTEDLLSDPHFKERGYFVEIDHPAAGKFLYPGAPFRAETPWRIRRPAPLLGEHNGEVYAGLGYSEEDLVRLKEMGVI